ncbi:MAG: hypothetical protein HYZ42_18855, partial [Bacteroidetes bacterium]|nr:hypothetical protein [Bacteroidota bacterium]
MGKIYKIKENIRNIYICLFIAMIFLRIDAYGQNYCTPHYNNNCQYGDYISSFQLNTISNSSTCSSNGFGDYTNLSTILLPGQSYTAKISCGFGGQYINGWIDYNNDGTFSNTEQIITNLSCASANTVYSVSVNISSSAQKGVHRMRIRCVYGTQNFGSCANYNYGEVEDYKVVIVDTTGVDITTSAIVSPQQLKVGSNTVQVDVTNLAKDTIKSIDLGYIFDNNSAVTQSLSGLSIA